MRIVFAGTSNVSYYILDTLVKNNYNVVGVLTKPDYPKGRGNIIKSSPIKNFSLAHGIRVFQPISLRCNDSTEVIRSLVRLDIDIILVVAYGLILPQILLDIPKHGCINVHFSLLPRWRGAAPIQRSIEAGDKKTGISIIQMTDSLDAGPVLHSVETPILPNDTSLSLCTRLMKLSIPSIFTVIRKIFNNELKPMKQQSGVTYAAKLKKSEGLVDFKASCQEICCKVRAFEPWPSVYIIINDNIVKFSDVIAISQNNIKDIYPAGTIIAIEKGRLNVQARDGVISIGSLQFPGRKMLPIKDIMNGRNLNYFSRIVR